MAHLPILNPESTQSDIHLHLVHLQETATQPITLCDEAITYNSTTQRNNWNDVIQNNKDLKPLRYFLKYPMPTNYIRAALFTTDTVSWVGQDKDPEKPYHAWVAVLVGKPEGKRGRKVLIWDPSGEHRMMHGEGVYNKVLLGSQRNLITRLGGKTKLEGVWYSKEGRNTDGNCLKASMQWLERLMKEGVPEDLEAAGFVKL